jgi:peptidoglycan/LPS O-acetylase OafA/YrhL
MRLTIAFGLLLVVGRVWLGMHHPPESFEWIQAYKDTAHLFMGGLAVAWWFQRKRWQWWLFWALNVVEVAVAILSRT